MNSDGKELVAMALFVAWAISIMSAIAINQNDLENLQERLDSIEECKLDYK